jgi:hypothetical protein
MHGRQAYAKHLRQAGLFVHPNPSEPFGIAPVEAMASGVPVVAPDRGGVLSYATNDDAWLCAANAQPFASSVIEACSNESESRRRSRNARATAERFDWTIISERYFSMLDTPHTRGISGMASPPLGFAIDAWGAAHAAAPALAGSAKQSLQNASAASVVSGSSMGKLEIGRSLWQDISRPGHAARSETGA